MKIIRQLGFFACLMVSVAGMAQTLTIEQFIEIEQAALALNVQRMQMDLIARQNGQLEDGSLQSVETLYQSYGVTVSDMLRFKKYHQNEIDAWYEQHNDDAEERDNLLTVMDSLSVQLEALATGAQP